MTPLPSATALTTPSLGTSPHAVLERLVGVPPFSGTRPDITIPAIARELRHWAIAQGVPQNAAMGDPTYKLAAAYANREYLRKWADGAKADSWRKNGSASGIDLDLDEDSTPRDPPLAPAPAPAPSAAASDVLTLANLERAADAVITKRLSAARSELERSTQKSILDAVTVAARTEAERIGIGERAKQTVRDLAASAAREAIEQALPRKLEITRQGAVMAVLGAEPRHTIFDTCLRWLSQGEHLYLVGTAGTGKTHLFEQLSVALGAKLWVVGQALTKYEFSGFIDGSGTYRGTVVRAWADSGGLLAMDELDTMGAQAVAFLNSALANGYIAFPNGLVRLHESCQVIASANTYGRGATQQFVGRNPLDAASLDRFTYIEVDYDREMEAQLYGRSAWLDYVWKIRDALRELKQPHIVSMRAIARGLRGYAAGFDGEEVARAAIWRGLADDTIAKIRNLAGNPPSRERQLGPDLKIVGVDE